jgi:hypothetical protein
VRAARQREVFFAGLQAQVDQMIAATRPPSEPEQVVYAIEEQGTGRLGYSDFNPRLMAQPMRWR